MTVHHYYLLSKPDPYSVGLPDIHGLKKYLFQNGKHIYHQKDLPYKILFHCLNPQRKILFIQR